MDGAILTSGLAMAVLVVLVVGWVAVQRLWTDSFAERMPDDEQDALAVRGSCLDCVCGGGTCPRRDEASERGRSEPDSSQEKIPT
jgi:hypothetical protein